MDEIIGNYDVSGDNIEFVDGEDVCRWRGILMTDKKMIELFGISIIDCIQALGDGILVINGYLDTEETDEVIFVNGDTLKDAIKNYVHVMKKGRTSVQAYELDQFTKIEPLPKTINIPLLLLFDTELNLYYKNMSK